MSGPIVSIIVPVYNAEKTIQRCVESILGQDFQDFELLLIDDGSQDASGALCDAFAQRDARVRVLHKENGGVSAARNLGLSQAQGVYLQFLDSDDWITADATTMLVRTAREYQCDLVISDFYRVVGDRVSHKGDIQEDTVLSREEYAAHMMERPGGFLLRRALEQALSPGDCGAASPADESGDQLVRRLHVQPGIYSLRRAVLCPAGAHLLLCQDQGIPGQPIPEHSQDDPHEADGV